VSESFERALKDAGGADAPASATAGLRRLLLSELARGQAELGLKRSGYRDPVVTAVAPAPGGLLAVAPVDAALRADPGDYRALNLLGDSLDLQGRHAEAQANYRRGIELAPDYMTLRSNYGLSLAITGPPQEAIAQLAPAAGSARADSRMRQNLAFAFAMAGVMENALQLCRRDLDERNAQRQLAYYMQLRALPPELRSAEFRRNPGLVASRGGA
jgi:tetratricopeptide (TPR) repeat protein